MARPITPAIDRALDAVTTSPTGCWEYQGTLNAKGYGVIGQGRALKFLVHRLVYEHIVGPIPDGLTIDHLCFNPCCCNPAHLEPVTRSDNTKREWVAGRVDPSRSQREQTHCKRGHPFDEANTRHYRERRHCRACHNEYMRNWKKER